MGLKLAKIKQNTIRIKFSKNKNKNNIRRLPEVIQAFSLRRADSSFSIICSSPEKSTDCEQNK